MCDTPKSMQISLQGPSEGITTGVMYWAEDVVGLLNEIVALFVKYISGVRQRDSMVAKLRNDAFLASLIVAPLSCFVVNKTINWEDITTVQEAVTNTIAAGRSRRIDTQQSGTYKYNDTDTNTWVFICAENLFYLLYTLSIKSDTDKKGDTTRFADWTAAVVIGSIESKCQKFISAASLLRDIFNLSPTVKEFGVVENVQTSIEFEHYTQLTDHIRFV